MIGKHAMSEDDIFRWIMIGGFIAVAPVGFYHRFKAVTSEKLDRRQEGLFLLVSIRLLASIGMAGIIAFLIDPTWMAWASVPLPIPVRWAGVGVGISVRHS